MSAVIHFIGLLTLVASTSVPPGNPHIVIPRFSDIIKKENNVLRVPTSAIALEDWEKSSKSPSGYTDFFLGDQTISIAAGGSFGAIPIGLPRLTCCCEAMKGGLSPDFNDSDPSRLDKKSAYVELENGVLSEYLIGQSIHPDLTVTPINGLITITGVRHSKIQTVVINVPASGPPLEISFWNVPDDTLHDSHWSHYYKMARVTNTCAETPKNDPTTCGPKLSGCLTSDGAAKPAKPAAKLATAAAKKLRFHLPPFIEYVGGDINCSSSSWP
jgi:hypothetical protein